MARKLRLEFPGAIYHIINRGNYRGFVFRSLGARDTFEDCLLDACQRSGWRLHAYVIMGNHYHLALETPLSNLVPSMQWLQSSFANRFNKLLGKQGHLFQGRYKSLLVEEGELLGPANGMIRIIPTHVPGQSVSYVPGSYPDGQRDFSFSCNSLTAGLTAEHPLLAQPEEPFFRKIE